MAKNIYVEETKTVTFEIDLKEILEKNNYLNIVLMLDGEIIKQFGIGDDEICYLKKN